MSRIAETYCVGTRGTNNLIPLADKEVCLIRGQKCDGGGALTILLAAWPQIGDYALHDDAGNADD